MKVVLEARQLPVVELHDISEGGYLCARKGRPFLDDVVRENVERALKRAGIWEEGMGVVVSPEVRCGDGHYLYRFEAFKGIDVYLGIAYGHAVCYEDEYRKTKDPCDIYAELQDMTLEF